VLRSGGDYEAEHVRGLMEGVARYWPANRALHRVVLTDTPCNMNGVEEILLQHRWPRWWSKLELFRPDLAEGLGDILFFDLDTVIVGDLTDVAEVSYLTLLEDFYQSDRLGSGMMYLPAEMREAVWQDWIKDPGVVMHSFRGDQEYLTPWWEGTAERWQMLLPGQVVSYKVHVRGGVVPEGVRVVCFHGRPRPWQIKGWE